MTTQTTIAVNATRKAVYDKVEAQLHTFEARLATLKAKAESAKADAEITAIAKLATAIRALNEKVAELKNASEATFERVKADVERRLAEFNTSLQALASRING